MRTRRSLALEPLESRHLLSGDAPLDGLLASHASAAPASDHALVPAIQYFLASTGSAAASDSRWDWLAQTDWYVPSENMLAYSTNAQLVDPAPLADQTLWHFDLSSHGQLAGQAVVKLSISPIPSHMTFTGYVTEGGQIRIEFDTGGAGHPPTTGIGQMRFVQGAWRVEMQMATGSSTLVTHWAYMSEPSAGTTPPDPTDPAPDASLLAEQWRWLKGTHWAMADAGLFGSANVGVFAIDDFRNGYFWGSGTSDQPFRVLGSVTPEGNLLLVVSNGTSDPDTRTGILQQTTGGGEMTLRSYDGQTGLGKAWTLTDPAADALESQDISVRAFLASSHGLSS